MANHFLRLRSLLDCNILLCTLQALFYAGLFLLTQQCLTPFISLRESSPPPLPAQAPAPVRKDGWKVKAYKETQEAANALVSLGYKKKEAESMIKSVYYNGMTTEQLINKVLGTE